MQSALQLSALPPLRHLVTSNVIDLAPWASEMRVLSAAMESPAPAAIFELDELARVRAVAPHTTLAQELRRVNGGPVRHAATILYRFRDALVAGGRLYVAGARVNVGAPSRRQLASAAFWRSAAHSEEGMLCASPCSSLYFGHWVTEQLSAELLAERLGIAAYKADEADRSYPHAQAMRAATGLQARGALNHRFDTLWLAMDHGQNESKRARYLELRRRLRAGAHAEACAGVLIMRGGAGSRRELLNELEIARFLRARGFSVVNPGTDSLDVLRDRLYAAPIAVGVEGSALIHASMLMPRAGCVLAIQPPYRFNNVHKNYTDCIGQSYAFTVADPDAQGFVLRPERLSLLLDRVESAQALEGDSTEP